MFNRKKKKADIEVFNVLQAKNILSKKQVVWAWCEQIVGEEWREVIYNGYDLYLKYDHVFSVEYSLHPNRRLSQNVKWFVLTKHKPDFKFNRERI
jgi:hypothetical protein